MAVTPESLYNKFPNDLLLELSAKTGIKYEKRRPSKQLQVETLAQKAANEGISQIIHLMKKTQLEDLSATLDSENLAANGNNPKNQKVIAKRLREAIGNNSIDEFLRESQVSVETLKGILSSAGVVVESDDEEELLKQIGLEAGVLGLWAFFEKLSPEDLQYFAEGLGLDVASSKKADLIGCIVAQTDFATPAEKKARKKPAIDAKITAKQLNQHYTQATIARWLRQNEISDAGSKAQLVQRIVDHFKGKEVPKLASRGPKKQPSRARTTRNAIDRTTKDEKVEAMSEEESDEDTRDEMRKNFDASESEEDSSISYEVAEEDLIPVQAKKAAPKRAAKKTTKQAEEVEAEEAESAEVEEEVAAESSSEVEEEELEAEDPEDSEDAEDAEDSEEAVDYDIENNVYCVVGSFGDLSLARVREMIKKAGGVSCTSLTAKCTKVVTLEIDKDNKTIKTAKERKLEILGADFIKYLTTQN